MVWYFRITFRKKIIYIKNGNFDEIDDKDGHVYRLKKIDEIQEILVAERDKRNALITSYNKGVIVISVIDNCLGVAALGITGVCLLSTIVAAPAVIGMEAVSIVMGYFEL